MLSHSLSFDPTYAWPQIHRYLLGPRLFACLPFLCLCLSLPPSLSLSSLAVLLSLSSLPPLPPISISFFISLSLHKSMHAHHGLPRSKYCHIQLRRYHARHERTAGQPIPAATQNMVMRAESKRPKPTGASGPKKVVPRIASATVDGIDWSQIMLQLHGTDEGSRQCDVPRIASAGSVPSG